VSRAGVEAGPGVVVVPVDAELAFLHPLPIEALWGVGPATAKRLHALGVKTVGDIAAVGEPVLVRQLGRAHGEHLFALAGARDPSPVVPGRAAKSIGHEQTFPTDVTDPAVLRAKAVAMSDSVAEMLAREGLSGRTVTLKVRFGDFTTLTRSHTLEVGVDAAAAIAAVADALLEAVDLVAGVRLLGVSVSALGPRDVTRQLAFPLGSGPTDALDAGSLVQTSWEEVAQAVAAIRTRFGKTAVGPVSTLDARAPGAEMWGPSRESDGGRES
jgi:DNA polymerase-4